MWVVSTGLTVRRFWFELVRFSRFSGACMGFLQVLQFPLTVQRHFIPPGSITLNNFFKRKLQSAKGFILQLKPVSAVLKTSWYSCENNPMDSQPDMHYHWSSSWRCMMSSQISVWSLWIAALTVACCNLKRVDVWRWLHFSGLFLPTSILLTHPPTLSLSLSLPFPPTHVSVQWAVAVWQHHGGWMCGCRGDWECCLRAPGWTRK